MHILNAKSMWQKKKDGNQTVTPFSFYICFLGSNIIMCKVRFNIGVKSVSEACNRVLLHTFSFDLPVQFLASIL